MSTWGLNTSNQSMQKMVNPPVEVAVGKPIELYGHNYTVTDIRLYEGKIYLEVEDALTNKVRIPVASPVALHPEPNIVAVIRPTDRKISRGHLNQLPL